MLEQLDGFRCVNDCFVFIMVGYSGGKEKNPDYGAMKDHTESVLIEFDPTKLSYEDVLIEV